MKGLILIGGLGTRLRPLTCHTPKPMLPLVNRPFLDYQLWLFKRYNIKEVIFCISYLGTEFKRYYGTGKKLGLSIKYSFETDPLGTGGALKNALPQIKEPTLIFNGDILTDIDLHKFMQFHREHKAQVTLALVRVKDPTIYGLVETDEHNRIKRFLEKPSWDEVTCNTINAGMYLFNPEIIDLIPANSTYSLERNLFPNLLENKTKFMGYIYSGYWLDIGTVNKYRQAHHDILENKTSFSLSKDWGLTSNKHRDAILWLGKNVRLSQDIDVKGTVAIGDYSRVNEFVQMDGTVCIGKKCTIGQGSVLINCVILNNTKIGDGVRLENCLIGQNCTLEPHVTLSPGTALADESIVRRYSRL